MTQMTGPVLSDEPLDRFQPLGVFGQPVHQSHIQLQAALKKRLGDRYANLFATPHIDAQGNRVSWRSPVEGEVRNWSDLTDSEQAERALELQVMKSELEAYMAELHAFEGQGRDAKAATAFVAVLEQALKTPNDGYLFFVGDQPVSAFWGFREEEAEPFQTLTAAPRVQAAAAGLAAAAGTTEERQRRPFPWLWLLIPLLLLLLLFLLWWFWPDDTPAVDELNERPAIEEPVAEDVIQEEDTGQLDYAERDGVLYDREGNVVPSIVDDNGRLVPAPDDQAVVEDQTPVEGEAIVEGEGTAEGDPPIEGETPDEGETPLDPDEAGGQAPEGEAADEEGQTPETPAEQPDEGQGDEAQTPEAPEPPEPEQAGDEGTQPGQDGGQPETPSADPGEPPAIPDNAADGAAGFMEGDWRSDSGLVDGQTGGRLSQEFRFDENGKGETVVRKSDGVTCRAPADATVKDGNLHVEEKSNLQCSDGTSFKRSRTVCIRGGDGKVRCRGVDSDGQQFDVQMNRGGQP